MVRLSFTLGLTFVHLFSACSALVAPLQPRAGRDFKLDVEQRGKLAASINADFPDPTIIQGHDGMFYAFATNGNGKRIQAASSRDPLSGWDLYDNEILPDKGWTTGSNTWAPDVRQLRDGSYVMYFSGEVPGTTRHCIGIARSENVLGPYRTDPEPWVCPLDQGGAIDASGFQDPTTGHMYVVYKVDGNNIGHGGDCNNSIEPLVSTPIMLQQVSSYDGTTKIGSPVKIMDRNANDGPLVEAPDLIYNASKDSYILFFSSHCFTDRQGYDVKYATAKSVAGPYTRAARQLMRDGDFGLTGPGGGTSINAQGNEVMVFHAWCTGNARCMYTVAYETDNLN